MTPQERLDIQDLLPLVATGIATPEERARVRAALEADAALRAELEQIKLALSGLAAPVAPPAALKARVMDAAKVRPVTPHAPRVQLRRARGNRRSFPRAWMWLGGALVAALALVFAFIPRAALGASVVATTADGGLIVGRAGVTNAVLVRPDRSRVNVNLGRGAAAFTDATSSGGVAYLLDAQQRKLYLVSERSGALLDTWSVPDGASSVAVAGDTVVVKGAISGTVAVFGKTSSGEKTMLEVRIAPPTPMPMADVMDATLIVGDVIYATHHTSGEVCAFDKATGRELARFKDLGAPVALARAGDALLVLDHAQGRLLELDPATGAARRTLTVGGNADRLSVMDGVAYLSDRAGTVTGVNLETFTVLGSVKLEGTPMDLAPMANDHLAVALQHRGVVVLDRALKVIETID
jgi:hypothetical protein